ncbi:putative membrane-associated kinase regulator 2 [Sesamum alatum]|uniref:Membrane-associated kinase regulator 2 n=1 Tax=Sesamum alatum TaxID=300844 RepID=A0AAE1YSJ2_9LAMI|nr:putative membrane-associated kinase regulator 2 [Sesamum alatum]
MEAFSLLKYWRSSGGAAGGATTGVFTADSNPNARASTKTIVASAASPYSSDGEDGPYFDLEFTLPEQESDAEEEPSAETQETEGKAEKTENEDETESGSDADEEISEQENDDDEEGELKFAVTSNDGADENVTLSPSDELFFKGNLVSIEPSSILLNGSGSEENSKIPVFLLKSATKFRVLLLKLKKSKPANGGVNLEKPDKNEASAQVPAAAAPSIGERENQGKVRGKLLAVKFKVEEVPIVSLFTRDSSSKENPAGKGLKPGGQDSDTTVASDEKKLAKEVVQKYLKMVKPFYIRVSKRYVEKLKFSGHLSFPGGGSKGCAAPPSTAGEKGVEGSGEAAPSNNVKTPLKQGTNNLQAGLKVVRKRLGKSRSASAAVAASPPGKTTSNRRDDSLLQVQDGIQGAILHCKKSFNASRDVESSSILWRSVSDPSYEKSLIIAKASTSSYSGEPKNKEAKV